MLLASGCCWCGIPPCRRSSALGRELCVNQVARVSGGLRMYLWVEGPNLTGRNCQESVSIGKAGSVPPYLSFENFLSSIFVLSLLEMVRASNYKLFGISLSLVPMQGFKLGVLFLLWLPGLRAACHFHNRRIWVVIRDEPRTGMRADISPFQPRKPPWSGFVTRHNFYKFALEGWIPVHSLSFFFFSFYSITKRKKKP